MIDRVLVIGPPGAGKTTLGRALAAHLDLPLVDLDEIYWGPGWSRPEPESWLALQREVVGRSRWVISGNYQSSLGLRASRADGAIALAPGRAATLARLARRTGARLRGDTSSLSPVLRTAPRLRSMAGLYRLVQLGMTYERAVLPDALRTLNEFGVPCVVEAYPDVDRVVEVLAERIGERLR